MITQQCRFLDFLGAADTRFIVPFYQRAYAWTTSQCRELWTDLMRAGTQGTTHFMSMVLFAPSGYEGNTRYLDIIDGQQRIASATIMLAALEQYLRKHGKTVAGLSADDLARRYVRMDASSSAACKVQLLNFDQKTLNALVQNRPQPIKPSEHVTANYQFFLEKMEEESFDVEVFWAGMQQLLIISVELDESDKAQEIFESLNAKGLPLSTADLVRNYLLVAETRPEQRRLYQEYWNPIELMFGEDVGSLKLNTGIRMWLSIRFRRRCISDKKQVYSIFKTFMTTEYTGTTEELLAELRGFCLMWAENYKFNEVKEFRCMDWAQGKRKTLLPEWGSFSGF